MNTQRLGARKDLLKDLSAQGLPAKEYARLEQQFGSVLRNAPPGVVHLSYPLPAGGFFTMKRTLGGDVVAHVYPGNFPEYSLLVEERRDHKIIKKTEKEVLAYVRGRLKRLGYASHELTGEGVPGLGYIGPDRLLLGFRDPGMLSGNQGTIEVIGHGDSATVTIETSDTTLEDTTEFVYPKPKIVEKVRR